MKKVTKLKTFRRDKRKQKLAEKFESNFIALGSVTANSWTPKQRCVKASEAMQSVLAGLNLHGAKREAVDNAWMFLAASFDYALQSLEGQGYDPATLKALGLEAAQQETAH